MKNYKKFIHYFSKNKNKIAFETINKKIKYLDLIKLSKSKINFEKKIILILVDNYYDSILLYSISIITNNIIIIVDYKDDIHYLKLLNMKYKPTYILFPKKKSKKIDFVKKVNINFENSILVETNNNNENLNSINKVLLSTSGTTGSPKMVRLSEKNLISNSLSICSYLKISFLNKCITTLSPSYSYGLSIINTHLVKGAKIFISEEKITSLNFWKLIEKNSVDSISLVPSQFEILFKYNFFNKKLKKIKYMTSAGGMLKEKILNYLRIFSKKNNIRFYVMYGQTEASPRMSYYLLNKNILPTNCIGKSVKDGKLWIKKSKNKDNHGEIYYSGPNVFLGYAENLKDLKKKIKKNKILKTGDLGFKDNKGNFYITGRKKRIVKINNLRISLDHLEQIFRSKKVDIKCQSNNNKILILYKNKKYKKILKNYFLRYLNLENSNFVMRLEKELNSQRNKKI